MAEDQPTARTGANRSPTTARVVVADDHPVIRRGVRDLLAGAASPGYSVVAEVDTPTRAHEAVRRLHPDVLLIDVSMPPGSGLDVLDQCLHHHPDLAAVVFTVHRDVALVRRAIALGARGYVLKDALAGELVTAVRLAQHGSTYLPPGIARLLADAPPASAGPGLDAREETILRLIALGYTGAEISEELGFSERTVKNYRARIADKLGLHQRRDLTRWALRHGLIRAEDADGPRGQAPESGPRAGGGRANRGTGRPPSVRARAFEPSASVHPGRHARRASPATADTDPSTA
jgi:two-component system, NarL family, response regulator NreC